MDENKYNVLRSGGGGVVGVLGEPDFVESTPIFGGRHIGITQNTGLPLLATAE